MPKTITIRLNDAIYNIFKKLAEEENRTLSNFIETAAIRYIEEVENVDEFEMTEIRNNKSLNQSLKQGVKDAKQRQGRFAA
jgi:predicted DNA-binding protein